MREPAARRRRVGLIGHVARYLHYEPIDTFPFPSRAA